MIAELATVRRPPVVTATLRLCYELKRYGITADPHEGHQVAALSVAYGLVVWCEYGAEGLRYRWWTGRLSQRTGRWIYTFCPASAVTSAARRVAMRYQELCPRTPGVQHPLRPSPWPI
jgi:hypothetical protein